MTRTALVLGARGRFGRAATRALLDAGWSVRALARSWPAESPNRPRADPDLAGAQCVTGDALNVDDIINAATSGSGTDACDVIVNAVNPLYPDWARVVPPLTQAVIDAAQNLGARVVIPGNVYGYGAHMPPLLRADTPQAPTTRKGRLRTQMEAHYAASGTPTLILRMGDFIEREKTGNWFDSYITPKLAKGRVTYPGPLTAVHAWAYLPDAARALAGVLEHGEGLPAFADVGFAGYSLTGRDLIAALEPVSGRTLRVGGVPWPLLRLLGAVSPMMREVSEMAYLWRTPHAICGEDLARLVPSFEATPLDVALAEACQDVLARRG